MPAWGSSPRARGATPILTYVALRDSPGGTVGLCERLPAAPAIYAWLRTIRIPANRGPQEFVSSIVSAIEAPAAPEWAARLGPMHRATLESRSELAPPKQRLLEDLAELDDFREYAAPIFEAAALLQAPLYVGKAQDLQRRTRQHLEPMSELATRLREAAIRIDDCTLAYAIIDAEHDSPASWMPTPSVLRLIEEIITRICRPGFVERPG